MKKILFTTVIGLSVVAGIAWQSKEKPEKAAPTPYSVLKTENYRQYIEAFNSNDDEQKVNFVGNKDAWNWMQQNIPFFECSDKNLEEMYYFRWWTFRKHIKQTPDGFVITEFLPDVSWAGKYNTISCAAGHHFYEGRWLRDRQYLKDYAYFWFKKGGEPRRYSFWAADAIRAWSLVTHDQQLAVNLYPHLKANFGEWEKTHRDPNGLFWQIDDRDGMEVSIGGSGYRPTINSYMYGEAMALSEIARWTETPSLAGEADFNWNPEDQGNFAMNAAEIRELAERCLWDERTAFYKTLPRAGQSKPALLDRFNEPRVANVREEIGFVPWYFNLPKPGKEEAWKQLHDPQGFKAPFGPTTAEQRNEKFMFKNEHECLWNGPSWPFATSQTLTAMANLLNNYKQNYVGKKDYLELLKTYAKSQHLKLPNGKVVPFIDEDLDPNTGDWIARTTLYGLTPDQQKEKGGKDRGRDYNHSTFNDLIITGLVGLRPREDQTVEINPLVPEDVMDYFCLDGVRYHDCNLTILWDKTGKRYGKGKGLRVFADGQEIGSAPGLQWMRANLPETAPGSGWKKYEGNPVIDGGKLGGLMDVTAMKEGEKYRMWGTLWHHQSIAEFTGTDGIHWSEPEIIFRPNPESGWEDGVNRQCIIKREDGYHLWYMGSANGHGYLGYATSPDCKNWKRMSDKPLLSPELPWEGVAVMSPHVVWDRDQKQYRMWYCGGGLWEPNAIGYATSPDGVHWTKYAGNPIMQANPANVWEQERLGAPCVVKQGDWYYMFYIGYRDIDHAQIGMVRSKDGITNWERNPMNPIVRPCQDNFDKQAIYKPFVLFDGKKWMLWYNGGRGDLEKIAMVELEGEELGF